MKRVLALSDSLSPWHSFWIRFGQYIPSLADTIQVSNDPTLVDQLQCGDTLFLYRFSPTWWPLLERLPMLRRMGIRLISDVDDCRQHPRAGTAHGCEGLHACSSSVT